MHVRAFVTGAAVGAAAAYLFDPDAGNGRRSRLRDQTGAMLRRGRERADELSRHAGNVIEGKLHEVARAGDADRAMDDATIADRIRSEVLGRRGLDAADVVVNVEGGVAYLRGAAPRPEAIDEIVERTAAVAGVGAVENLMHLPETPAPNKQAARSAGQGTTST
jgi:osmotically-inducible protein OsmY